ncbi:MAG: ankyrin repeat domain-containing protein [Sphingobacteriia bacterium]|nr:ankyrin repeat domain-containing protein [Sphingobacteriia bacterium]
MKNSNMTEESGKNQDITLSDLPPEIIERIFSFLDPKDYDKTIPSLLLSNKTFRNLAIQAVGNSLQQGHYYGSKIEDKFIGEKYTDAIKNKNLDLLLAINWPINYKVINSLQAIYKNNIIKLINAAFYNDIEEIQKILKNKNPFTKVQILKLMQFEGKCDYKKPFTIIANQLQLIEALSREDEKKLHILIKERQTVFTSFNLKLASNKLFAILDHYQDKSIELRKARKTEEIIRLINEGANPNFLCFTLETILHHLLIENTKTNLIQIFIKFGANPNALNYQRATPLQIATFKNINMIETLVNNGADPDHRNGLGMTSLHNAVKEGKVLEVKELLKFGAIPNILCKKGFTPLHYAASEGNKEMVNILLNCGADPYLRNKRFLPWLGANARELTENKEIKKLLPWSIVPILRILLASIPIALVLRTRLVRNICASLLLKAADFIRPSEPINNFISSSAHRSNAEAIKSVISKIPKL